MKITYKGDYALKAILDLALHEGIVVTIQEIANRSHSPIKFLEQVLLELKRGGFVVSKRGKVGGYLLARPPSAITVGDVVRFIDGPVEPIACVSKEYDSCEDLYKCVFRPLWKQVTEETLRLIDSVTFQELARKARPREKEVHYSI